MKEDYAINEETGKPYKLKADRFEQPHLVALKKEAENVPVDSKKYWELRCRYLEKTLDKTYVITERENCQVLYFILRKKEINYERERRF